MKYWSQSVELVLRNIGSDPDNGLTAVEAKKRFVKTGPNELPDKKRDGLGTLLLRQVQSPLVLVLFAALAITVFIHEVIDSIVIGITIFVNGILGFVQEYKVQKAVEALKKLGQSYARVIRDGHVTQVPVSQVVPGDILFLEAGQIISADARIIESFELQVNEAVLTGESRFSKKSAEPVMEDVVINDQYSMVFAGTSVVDGKGKAVVVSTGVFSEVGKIANEVSTVVEQKTPLQKQLHRLSLYLLIAVGVITVVIFFQGVLANKPIYDMFLFTLALAVSVVPEGLAISVTIALAVGMYRMASSQAIVKTLPAVEGLGAITVAAIDKTGTLTENTLSVTSLYFAHVVYDTREELLQVDISGLVGRISALANGAQSNTDYASDSLDVALLAWLNGRNISYHKIREQYSIIDEIPFSSTHVFSAVMTQHDHEKSVYMKGSPEAVLSYCTQEIVGDLIHKMGDTTREDILGKARMMARNGLKPIALAYVNVDTDYTDLTVDSIPHDFVCVGLVGFSDTIRDKAPESVAFAYTAGIRVMMLTGDHGLTASTIAGHVGIRNHGDVIEGAEIDSLSNDQLKDQLSHVNVYARVTPTHKLRIVTLLQEMGEVVAMTGDGVNDAPALIRADIGVAMGIGGTDVARGAADMIISDNNFATIVKAIEEGRTIFDNLKKVVLYLLSTNASEVFLVIGALLMGAPLPLYPTQILWLNLITDGLPASALIFEPKDKNVLLRKPRKATDFILDKIAIVRIAILGLTMAVVCLAVFLVFLPLQGVEYARTMVLQVAAFSQLVNAINAKVGIGSIFTISLWSNKFLTGSLAVAVLLQIAVTTIPALQTLFRTVPLSWYDWGVAIGVSLIILCINEILSWYIKRRS